MIEKWITRGATGASVSKVEPSDGSAEGRFALQVEFSAARYAQLMQGRLMIFKPAIIERDDALPLTETSRKHPVVLEPRAYTESVQVKLPVGFHIDEMPDAVKLATPFGAYTTHYEVKDGQLHFSRSLSIKGATVPVSEWTKVKHFFDSIKRAEESPVVLARK
jgi:hypothetical protein